jgi:hypothetical protein
MPPEDREVRKASNREANKTEDSYYFDDLARGLADGTISRRQALKWAGAGIVGAVLATAGFAEPAEALTRRQRRRCRDKGGVPLEEGNCNCAFQCGADLDEFNCQGDSDCYCLEKGSGGGFCGYGGNDPQCGDFERCDSNRDCSDSDARCITTTCCDRGICVRPCSTGRTTSFGAAVSTQSTGAVGTPA